jgi:hypothetical protein
MTTNSSNTEYQIIEFKTSPEIVRRLKEEAQKKDISVDPLLNEIIEQHFFWHLPSRTAGFIPVRAVFVARLLKEINDEEKIKSIARESAQSLVESLQTVLKDQYKIEATLDLMERWSRTAGFQFKKDISNEDNSTKLHQFMIHHQMGRRWSIYLSELFRHIFSQFNLREMHFDTTSDNNTLIFTINTESKTF